MECLGLIIHDVHHASGDEVEAVEGSKGDTEYKTNKVAKILVSNTVV